MDARDSILSTLDDYADAYCAKDTGRLMAIFVDGDDISLIGTGADELCSGRAEVASVFDRNFAAGKATRFKWGWKDIAIHGDAATISVAVKIHLVLDGESLVVPVRWTVSLVRVDGKWKWVHRHASVAAGGQDDGTAYPTGDTLSANATR